MNKILRSMFLAFSAVILLLTPLSGCNRTANKDALSQVSSLEVESSVVSASSTVSESTAFKNTTCKVRLAKATEDWKGFEAAPPSEKSRYQTYSIDLPDTWVFKNNEASSPDSAETENDYRVLNVGDTSVAVVHPLFYIPEGVKIPDNYIEIYNEDEEGNCPKKISDIKIGALSGAIGKQEGTYFAEDTGANKGYEYYNYYLTDGKTVFYISFYINDDTKDLVNEKLCDKIMSSVKFVE